MGFLLKLSNPVKKFYFLSWVDLLDARDGFIMLFLQRLRFRTKSCDTLSCGASSLTPDREPRTTPQSSVFGTRSELLHSEAKVNSSNTVHY